MIFAVTGYKTINIPGIFQGFKVFRFHSEFVVDVYKKRLQKPACNIKFLKPIS